MGIIATILAAGLLMAGHAQAADRSQADMMVSGCQYGEVYFQSGSARLDAQARGMLENIAAGSVTLPTSRYVIHGYTDPNGSAFYNLGLSIRRAEAVAAYLVREGIPAERIEVRGEGEVGRPEDMGNLPRDVAMVQLRRVAIMGWMTLGDYSEAAERRNRGAAPIPPGTELSLEPRPLAVC